ncbi:ABC transporter ATP-binding protein [Deferrisoma camini]|uniref:ABC transporter ATP-binding protein n=1 Tax=Deferrisoma camini TaxID=1035120 RepID=UPI0004A4DB0C|nr:ABC transporter ATP-binding protein [Deferrisoma camini]
MREQSESTPILRVEHVTMDFDGLRALNDCSFVVEPGEIFAVIGPNGAGKSTLFNVITGLYRPTQGQVYFRGVRVDRMRPNRVGRMGMARSFQNLELFKGLTAAENVLVGGHRHLGYGFFRALWGDPGVRRREARGMGRARDLLGFLGVAEFADVAVDDLPYGVQKKVEVARALATDPVLLLLDEPAAGLNDAETEDLMETVRRIRDERGITVVLVEHNMRFVMGLSDRVCVLNYGSILAQGRPDEVRSNPRVVEAYLGEEPC